MTCIVAADTPFVEAAPALKELGVEVRRSRPTSPPGRASSQLLAAIAGRPVDVLVANAGHGLGNGFLDQDPEEWRHVIDTNITGTLLLIQPIVRADGRARQRQGADHRLDRRPHGRAVQRRLQRLKAFIDSFSAALGNEIKDSGVTVTWLKPGATETNFFHRAGLDDTKVGQAKKDDPADVAKTGWDAMMKGEPAVIHGIKNKLQVAAADVMTDATTAKLHRAQAEPGQRHGIAASERFRAACVHRGVTMRANARARSSAAR